VLRRLPASALCYTCEVPDHGGGRSRLATNSILLSVLLVLASVLCGVGIWALFEATKTSRSVRILSDDLDARVVPLLEKADITVDALNAELLRIDSIVTQIEEITARVDTTSRTVQDVANAPAEIVTDIADRVRRAWKNRQAQSAADREAASEPAGPDSGQEAGSAYSQASPDGDATDETTDASSL
jgi:hypothetical protein